MGSESVTEKAREIADFLWSFIVSRAATDVVMTNAGLGEDWGFFFVMLRMSLGGNGAVVEMRHVLKLLSERAWEVMKAGYMRCVDRFYVDVDGVEYRAVGGGIDDNCRSMLSSFGLAVSSLRTGLAVAVGEETEPWMRGGIRLYEKHWAWVCNVRFVVPSRSIAEAYGRNPVFKPVVIVRPDGSTLETGKYRFPRIGKRLFGLVRAR